MKKILFLTLLLWNTVFAQVHLNQGLVAYYPFNGNANDESGNNNNPSLVKVVFTADRFGKPNAACSFNGKNNYIKIPDNRSLHFPKGFSISAWVRINDFYEGLCHGNRIIMKGNADYLDGNYLLGFDDNYASDGTNCETLKPNKKKQTFYGANAMPLAYDFIVTGKWYLLTYTYDGTKASLYVDCKLYGRGTLFNYDFSNNYDLVFGRLDNPQYPYWFNGLLDEVRIYNRPLNKDEIFALCDKNMTKLDPDVICTGNNKAPAKFDYLISDCNTVSFNLTAINTKNRNSIQWYFGDGTTSNKPSPIHTYKRYGTYKVKAIVISKAGCADTVTKLVQIQELRSDFVFTEQSSPGEVTFRVKNNKAAYAWNFGDETNSNGESAITHLFKESGQYNVRLFAKNSVGCTDTVEKNIAITLPELETVAAIEKETVTELPVISAPAKLEKRTKDVLQTIQLGNDSVSISLYDNGIIDGDSITLLFNDNIILTHQLLKSRPLTLQLKMDPDRTSNELVMYAENLGSIPPNTALMIINDGGQRYEVSVSSTRQSNGVISFTLRR
ncbi:MAG: PKD domain-containing protein [Chitinophagaceae bacterium]